MTTSAVSSFPPSVAAVVGPHSASRACGVGAGRESDSGGEGVPSPGPSFANELSPFAFPAMGLKSRNRPALSLVPRPLDLGFLWRDARDGGVGA